MSCKLFAFIFAAIAALVVAGPYSKTGWTYKSTSASCAGTPWSKCGIAYWGQVSGDETCGTGTSQTPIDLTFTNADLDLDAPVFSASSVGCNSWYQFANNYTFEVSFVDKGCTNLKMTYDETSYTLKQIHFHSPSEHTIAGGYYSAEAHLVHMSDAGALAVVGVFLMETSFQATPSNNTFMNAMWNLGNNTIETIIDVEVEDGPTTLNPYHTLVPARPTYYTYSGSLTTPPCTEGIKWIVMDQPVAISPDDLRILRDTFKSSKNNIVSESGNNNRYPQKPLNGRTVKYYAGFDYTEVTMDDDDSVATDSKNALIVGSVALGVAGISFGMVAFLLFKQFSTPTVGHAKLPTDEHQPKAVELTPKA